MADAPFSLPAGLPADPALFPTLLDLLPLGVIYYTPVVDANGTLTDLTLAYLNPAAQRMTRLPAQPGTTYRQQFPTTADNGAWDFHRRSWLGQEAEQFQFYYQADGFDAYFRVTAQRLGDGLLVLFSDTRDEERSHAEEALRATQAREQAARAEAEARQATLYGVFEQAPVAISLLQGPTHVIEFANARMAQLWDRPLAQVAGQAHFTALPELAGQGFEEVLGAVWRTGEPYYLQEQLVSLRRAGQPYQGYFNITYQPSHDGQGQRTGVLTSAIDVTEQVLARQQVEQLNHELEARVQARTQEAQAAQATAERERNLLQAVLTQAPVAIGFFQGEELRITETNAQMAALWGRTPAQVLGLPFMDAVPELRGQGFDEQMRQVLRTQVPFTGTETPATMLRHGRLQTTYYDFVYQPLYDTAGQLLGVIDVATEVTEQVLARRQVEQLNQELEARVLERTQQLAAAQAAAEHERAQLQAVFAQAPVAIALFAGEELCVTSANAAIATLWGSTPEQVVNRPLLEAVPELQGQGFDELLRQVLRTQEPFIGRETPALLRRGGQLHTTYFNFVYQPLYEADGQVTSVLCIAVDVTEQVVARQQVEQLNQALEARVQQRTAEAVSARLATEYQRRQLERLLWEAPAAVAIISGPELVFEFFNPLYAAMFAGRPQLGWSIQDALPELRGQELLATLRRVYETGRTQQETSLLVPLIRPADGLLEDRYFDYVQQARFTEQGQVDGVLVFAFEVTRQVLAQQQVQTLNEELAVINEELTVTNEELYQSNTQLTRTNVDLDTFVYTASHDLKAPITNIESITLALRDTLPPAVQQDEMISHLLDLLEQTTTRFQVTIGQLTDLSKLQLAHAGPAEPVHLAAVVEGVRLDLAPAIAAASAQLTVEVPTNLVASFSPANLRSAVYNLLSNAIKYRALDRPAQVRVHAARTPQGVVLTVQDNGLGMSAVQQRQLFGLFQRLHTHVEGTGVGLYITKRLVENGGGTIAVASQVDVGTTFTLTFPT
ncbi:PAS domain-containing protein [Hymenobacter sp. BT507]|uniref:histidine kinase n=1 Tax=Hymenobacter citatus TaxID=2763506 RepID=A0ABR7MQ52_9BACT|nr:PAS domain-containing protein [Hymenobacter citatus]MBC6613192.1 PAS domain-containing protein [Hymenobacter citatus]